MSVVSSGAQRGTVKAVVELMRADLSSRTTLSDLADAVGYSPFHLVRVFRMIVGIPPGEFQAALRFERAKRLMLLEGLSVTDACFEVGFNSLSTFSMRFSRLVGVNPAHFQRLPELSAGELPREAIVIPHGPAGATVQGTVRSALRGGVYVGLYPRGIAGGRPVCGAFMPEPGAFELRGVPLGTYRLLAAGIPDPLCGLIPDARIQVGSAGAVTIGTARDLVRRDILLRAPDPLEPPLLVALAALTQD